MVSQCRSRKQKKLDLPRIKYKNCVAHLMQDVHQVFENGLPNPKFKFVKKVWYIKLVKVDSVLIKTSRKGILSNNQFITVKHKITKKNLPESEQGTCQKELYREHCYQR